MIPLKKEDAEMFDGTGVYELCHFCHKKTDMWHENTNNPVCPDCAKAHKVAELPDHGAKIRYRKRKAKKELIMIEYTIFALSVHAYSIISVLV